MISLLSSDMRRALAEPSFLPAESYERCFRVRVGQWRELAKAIVSRAEAAERFPVVGAALNLDAKLVWLTNEEDRRNHVLERTLHGSLDELEAAARAQAGGP